MDEWACGEISLYIRNERALYNQMMAFKDNFAKKKKAGRYIRALAIKGLAVNLVPSAIQKYNREFGRGSISLTASEKEAVAKDVLEELEAEYLKGIKVSCSCKAAGSRTFEGKRFSLWKTTGKKSTADSYKETAKKKGKLTRVVKSGANYLVYTRGA